MFDTTTDDNDSDSRTAVQLLRDLESYVDRDGDDDDADDTLADRLATYDFDLNPEDPDTLTSRTCTSASMSACSRRGMASSRTDITPRRTATSRTTR